MVHGAGPFVAGHLAAAKQLVELARVGGQAWINEHAIARVTLPDEKGAGLEVVVHPLAQAMLVDETQRCQGKIRAVQLDIQEAAVPLDIRHPRYKRKQGEEGARGAFKLSALGRREPHGPPRTDCSQEWRGQDGGHQRKVGTEPHMAAGQNSQTEHG